MADVGRFPQISRKFPNGFRQTLLISGWYNPTFEGTLAIHDVFASFRAFCGHQSAFLTVSFASVNRSSIRLTSYDPLIVEWSLVNNTSLSCVTTQVGIVTDLVVAGSHQ